MGWSMNSGWVISTLLSPILEIISCYAAELVATRKLKLLKTEHLPPPVEIRWEFLLHIWIIPLKLERAAYKKSLNMGIYYFYSYSIVAFSYSKAKFIELRFGSLHMVIDHSICDILLEKLFGLFGVIILRSGQLQVVTHFLSRNIIECLLDNLFVFYP